MHFFSRVPQLATILTCLFLVGSSAHTSAQTTGMVEFFAAGKMQKGLPLIELTQEIVVIGRDGWMHSLDPQQESSRIRSLDERYTPASVPEIRNDLRAEFGRNFEVVSTQHFLVVQPRGRGDRWPRLFEQSHRGFVSYMRKRKVHVRTGRFPMVAIVFADEPAMYREFGKLNIDVKRVAGLYSGDSNRVMTHDGGRSANTAATVRHEAAHQSAFNSGVHSRVNDTPRWISEGIGQMFEPIAMTDPRGSGGVAARVNRDSIRFLKSEYSGRNDVDFTRAVLQLIGDDSMFEDPLQVEEAYAVSWAMMFYLAEREPAAFAEILNHTSKRPPFQAYSRTDRLRDFERITGTETFEMSKRMNWYLNSL